jgi:hypothetical protein
VEIFAGENTLANYTKVKIKLNGSFIIFVTELISEGLYHKTFDDSTLAGSSPYQQILG